MFCTGLHCRWEPVIFRALGGSTCCRLGGIAPGGSERIETSGLDASGLKRDHLGRVVGCCNEVLVCWMYEDSMIWNIFFCQSWMIIMFIMFREIARYHEFLVMQQSTGPSESSNVQRTFTVPQGGCHGCQDSNAAAIYTICNTAIL